MEKTDITIIGAGVIGLAVGAELSKYYKDIIIVEKNASFGQETSSRNSEVIHCGIYYPEDSLKTKTCIEGRRLLYEFCLKNNIPHKKIGKLVVAINKDEVKGLEDLFAQGLKNGVGDLKLLSKDEIKKIEPHIQAEKAIYSPSTGIIDSHSLMKRLVLDFESRGGTIAYNTELEGIDKVKGGFELSVREGNGTEFNFTSPIVINAAGLNSDKVAAIAGLAKDIYRLKYCKGDYFRLPIGKAKFIQRLIYPLPKKEGAGLGIHATLDLSGGLRLGPDDEYVDRINYEVDSSKHKLFYESAREFLPFIGPDDLTPDTCGIRPKLQGKHEKFRDFIIKDEADNNFPGLINLIGIESPGLTACLSIAILVKDILNRFFPIDRN